MNYFNFLKINKKKLFLKLHRFFYIQRQIMNKYIHKYKKLYKTKLIYTKIIRPLN